MKKWDRKQLSQSYYKVHQVLQSEVIECVQITESECVQITAYRKSKELLVHLEWILSVP